MKFPLLVEHILRVIFRCEGKLDLTSDDLQRSLTSKGQNIHWQSQKVVKTIYTMSMICFCVPNVCQILDLTVLNHKHNTKVMSRSHQGHLKVKLAENS